MLFCSAAMEAALALATRGQRVLLIGLDSADAELIEGWMAAGYLPNFARLRQHPRSVLLALVLQMLVLPASAVALIVLMGVQPIYAVGLMLLAASPGGVSANLFSHLFGGNVAMNISLTAINTVLSIVSLPLIANWAIATYLQSGQVVPLQFGKVLEVVAVVMVPVVIGMVVRRHRPAFSERMGAPMKRSRPRGLVEVRCPMSVVGASWPPVMP